MGITSNVVARLWSSALKTLSPAKQSFGSRVGPLSPRHEQPNYPKLSTSNQTVENASAWSSICTAFCPRTQEFQSSYLIFQIIDRSPYQGPQVSHLTATSGGAAHSLAPTQSHSRPLGAHFAITPRAGQLPDLRRSMHAPCRSYRGVPGPMILRLAFHCPVTRVAQRTRN